MEQIEKAIEEVIGDELRCLCKELKDIMAQHKLTVFQRINKY